MTGGYGLVLPLMLANMTSYMLARHWRPLPIYEALLEQDGITLPRAEQRTHALEDHTIASVMTASVRTLSPDMSIGDAARSSDRDTFDVYPVVDACARVQGIVTRSDLRMRDRPLAESVTTLMRPVQTIRVDVTPIAALVQMRELGVREVLVVDNDDRLVGFLATSDIARAQARSAPASLAARIASQPPRFALTAANLAMKTSVIAGHTKLPALSPYLHGASCLIVRTGEDYGVLFDEEFREASYDEDLERMLIAADLAHPAPFVDRNATLEQIARTLAKSQARAAIVVTESLGEPNGVVTRAAISEALLDWYVAHGMQVAKT
jgi:CBS domain-containing protein